jgi:hypothetical protein
MEAEVTEEQLATLERRGRGLDWCDAEVRTFLAEIRRLREENAGLREVAKATAGAHATVFVENERLRADLKREAARLGAACDKHDLIHSLACGWCHDALRTQLDEARVVIRRAAALGVFDTHSTATPAARAWLDKYGGGK